MGYTSARLLIKQTEDGQIETATHRNPLAVLPDLIESYKGCWPLIRPPIRRSFPLPPLSLLPASPRHRDTRDTRDTETQETRDKRQSQTRPMLQCCQCDQCQGSQIWVSPVLSPCGQWTAFCMCSIDPALHILCPCLCVGNARLASQRQTHLWHAGGQQEM